MLLTWWFGMTTSRQESYDQLYSSNPNWGIDLRWCRSTES